MNDDHGCLILPLSTNEFFVAYNLGKIDMKKEISEFVASGRSVRAMNLAYPVRYQSRSRVSPVAAVEFFIRGG